MHHHPNRAGRHQCVHHRYGFRIRMGAETPYHIRGQKWSDDDGRKECEADMIEGRVPGEEDEDDLVELPLPAAEEVGQQHQGNRRQRHFPDKPVQMQRLPLLGVGNVQLLIQHHVERVPDHPPTVRVEQERPETRNKHIQEPLLVFRRPRRLLKDPL